MKMKSLVISLALSCVIILASGKAVEGQTPTPGPNATLLVSDLGALFGTTVGSDGALYVAEPDTGRILRVDPQTGKITTFASGLPIVPFGGAFDVAFIGNTAYVLVTAVDPFAGGNSVDGIYRVDGPSSFTVIADIGQFAMDNPPNTSFDLPTGLQFALETYGDGFVVTDGHHNRVYRVTPDGQVSELIAFGNIVPTGLEVSGNTIYMAEAGPVPHLPQDGKVISFAPNSLTPKEIGSGAPLLVDVEFGRGHRLYALSQGDYSGGVAGDPALPNTGSLLEVNVDGTFTVVTDGLNQPTSLEFIGATAYVVTLTGEIWKIALEPQFANISARGLVQAGDNVLIGGFILQGDHKVLVRAIGPSLAQFHLSNALADPTLDLRDGNGARLTFNDNWHDDAAQAALITATGIPPNNNLESAIVADLPAGPYTAIVAGKNGGAGVALVEIYNLNK